MDDRDPAAKGAPDSDRLVSQIEREFVGWEDPVARIRQALERGEFTLLAQPILALQGEARYPMAEVLVRLLEEEVAMLPPGDFFPVFEHYGMMPQLDRWVVRHAAARLARGSEVPRFTVNVSGQTLLDAQFPADVGAEIGRAGIPPASLVFEIGEGDVLARPEAAARFAAAIRAIGCGALIDGFGRLAASFAPLKELRTDLVKVDGAIVRKLRASEAARARLGAVVRVGAVIGFGVIAECVEEPEIAELAKAAGADYAQGFGIRRPQALSAVAEGRF
jgi:EAL domain-containing protein (putative c-di-GMP-specific phosphodiesterase class I)